MAYMAIDYDGLRRESKNARMRSPILLCEHSNHLEVLLEQGRLMRPNLAWQTG